MQFNPSKTELAWALCLLACQSSTVPSPVAEPYDLGEALTATAAGAPSRADCEALKPYFAKGRPSPVPTKILAACLVYLCANTSACGAAPPPNPNPPMPGVGGSSPGIGGSSPVAGSTSATPEQTACVNLARLGCPEGSDQVKCASDMTLRCANPKVRCDTSCLISATSKSQLQTTCHLACGGL